MDTNIVCWGTMLQIGMSIRRDGHSIDC
jgi:hypothetical protein